MTPTMTVHFADNYIINPTNPVLVNLIGAGGTGGQVLTALARMNTALCALQHPGLQVTVYDDDVVTPANLGRQLFASSELGLPKAVALINRVNRFFGTNWKAKAQKVTEAMVGDKDSFGNITISCVDTVAARMTIAHWLRSGKDKNQSLNRPIYWMDFGNGQFTGQVILSTVQPIPQPLSKKFNPVNFLPCVTDEYEALLRNTKEENTPSCSLAEALTKQDLFINSTLAQLGSSLLWNLFKEGMACHRGFFVNLNTFQMQPIRI